MPSYSFAQQVGFVDNMNVASQRFANKTGLGTVVASLMGKAYPGGDYPGKVYYVNNITGASTNDGLTWGTAYDQITTAFTQIAVDQATFASTNRHNRTIVYVQGTQTAYTALGDLPSATDIVGIGAGVYGNGQGIPLIGVTGASGAVNTATVRGTFFYNVQFATGTAAYWCFQTTGPFLRGGFIDCSFLVSGTSTTGGCLNATNSFAGNVIRGCQFSGDSGYPAYGIKLGTGAANNNIIEHNFIGGTTAGIYTASGDDINTVWRDNVIGLSYPGSGGTTYGVQDVGSGGYSIYAGNYVVASDAFAISQNATKRTVGNFVINTTTGAIEVSVTDITTA
jgi:hypothetical protein